MSSADAHLPAKRMQVVSGAKEVTLPSGVTYTDVKIGGGSPVQKGYLMILDFKYASCTPVQVHHVRLSLSCRLFLQLTGFTCLHQHVTAAVC